MRPLRQATRNSSVPGIKNARFASREPGMSIAGAGGVEPPTTRLTVERSAIELHPKSDRIAHARNAMYPCHAQARDRTEMPLRARDFESRASASSATWARRDMQSSACARRTAKCSRTRGATPPQMAVRCDQRRGRRLRIVPSGRAVRGGWPMESIINAPSAPRRRRCASCRLRRNSSCRAK